MTRGSVGAGQGPHRRVAAVIPAAGLGKRMGGDTAKQYLPLNGKPILAHTLAAFEESRLISDVVLVVAESEVDACQRDIVAVYGLSKVTRVVAGGEERQDSVYRGLAALDPEVELVAVHDAARPLITADQLDWAVAAAFRVGPAIVAVPVKDTVKVVDSGGVITSTPDRRTLWAAQTPQIFPCSLLLAAHRAAAGEGFVGTDDASLVERLGAAVRVLEGWPENIKVTTPEDLLLAERILARRAAVGEYAGREQRRMEAVSLYVGFGYDIHRLETGRALVLGGVPIPHERGLLGHSDADVLIHAVMDAILGAMGEPDIGHQFPNTDPRYSGVSSLQLLRQVAEMMIRAGYRLQNLDSTVIAEEPKLAPHLPGMRRNLAGVLAVDEKRVSIKATTNEGLGSLGAGEGIAAHAVVLLAGA